MNPKKLKKQNDLELTKRSPECLLSQCIQYVADHLCFVDSFCGLPDLVGELIFKKAEHLNKFDLDDQFSFHAMSVFTIPYQELVASSLNLSHQYLGLNYCQDHISLFKSLREINLTGCRLGDDHDMLSHLGQLECLEAICLRDNSLSDTGIQRLTSPYRVCKKGPAGLIKLDLSENNAITGKCYKYLNPFHKLVTVDISSTQVKGNPDLLKTWKFKPVKDDGTDLPVIKSSGWAKAVVEGWMKTANNKSNSGKENKKLTQTQQFYKKNRKIEELQSKKEESISLTNVTGYRLLMVRIDRFENENISTDEKSKHSVHKDSGCYINKCPQQITSDDNTAETNNNELFSMYCGQSVKKEQIVTLKSALDLHMW